MIQYLFPEFLKDRSEYTKAVDHWVRLWENVDSFERDRRGWRQPWLFANAHEEDTMLDGNPIFSAWSPRLRKGIRVIQHQPVSQNLEFQWWLDTFGGSLTDPESIQELVIACALSPEATARGLELMDAWVRGGISESYDQPFAGGYPHVEADMLESEPAVLMY